MTKNIESAKELLINIMQEGYVFLRPRIKKDTSLLVGMGFRYEDHKRLVTELQKRIEDMVNKENLDTEDHVAMIGLALYNFYSLPYASNWRSWFKFMCVTDYDKSRFIQCLYRSISDEEIRDLLVRVLVNSSRMFYAYNLDKDFYHEEIQEEKDTDSKHVYDKIHDDEFKDFFEKL